MNEQNGHNAMLVARCKALEAIALEYMTLYHYETATTLATEKELKARLEKQVEKRAPGCGHTR